MRPVERSICHNLAGIAVVVSVGVSIAMLYLVTNAIIRDCCLNRIELMSPAVSIASSIVGIRIAYHVRGRPVPVHTPASAHNTEHASLRRFDDWIAHARWIYNRSGRFPLILTTHPHIHSLIPHSSSLLVVLGSMAYFTWL